MTGSKQVYALDLSEPSMLVWDLHRDFNTYYVFGNVHNGKYRYITFQGPEEVFEFEEGSDPSGIDLGGDIKDPRVFRSGSDGKLIVACRNDLNAAYSQSTGFVKAKPTGEGWLVC